MRRQVFLNVSPFAQAKQLTSQKGYEIFTPSRLSARALGVPQKSLWEYATKQLKSRGISIASALNTQRVFRQTIQEVLSPNDSVGTARTLLPTVGMLVRSFQTLESSSDEISQRARRILNLVPNYQSRLHESSLVDLNEIYWQTLKGSLEQRKVLFYGYFQLCYDEFELIDAISGDGSVLFLPTLEYGPYKQNQNFIELLNARGWQIDDTQTPPATIGENLFISFLQPQKAGSKDKDAWAVYAYGNLESESRGTLAQVKKLLHEGVQARDIVIVARNEVEYGPTLLDVAWEYEIPLRALYDTPLSSTRLGAWLSLLLEVISKKFPFELTAKLLSHPLCTNPDAEFWSAVRAKKPSNAEEWAKFSQDQLEIDLSILQVNSRLRRDNWVSWVQKIFKTFDLRRRCTRWSRESIAFNTLMTSLADLSRPESEILSWDKFIEEFQDTIDLLSVPAHPGRGGVELHGPSSLIGSRYRYMFILGMSEGIFPPPVKNDPVLDFAERKQLSQAGIKLESAVDAARKEDIGFLNLLQSITEKVVFSYPKLNDRQEQIISPYLKRLGLNEHSIPDFPLSSYEELRKRYLRLEHSFEDSVIEKANHSLRVELSREDATPHDEYDGIVKIPIDYENRIFSVSQLTSLGLCPFKWFAEKALKVRELDEDEIDLSPSLRGNLYHKTVELLFKAVQENPGQSFKESELLREKFKEAENLVKLPKLPAWEARREEHIRVLSLTLQSDDFLPEGAKAVAIECDFEGIWQGFRIKGRVDRIDRTESGLVLIDYKAGSKVPNGVCDETGTARLDLQLPIYKAVAAADLFPNESVGDAYYYSLGKGEKLTVSKNSVASEDELSMFAERCKSHFINGHFPVKPDKKKVACEYCSFDPVCRQGSRLIRKGGIDESN